MRNLRCVVSIIVGLAVAGALVAPASAKQPEMVRVLVGFESPAHGPQAVEPQIAERAGIVKSARGRTTHSFRHIPVVVASMPRNAIAGLLNNPRVAFVEEDGEVWILEQELPWGVDRIDAEMVHPNNQGAGVKVAILDTGIDLDHPDLRVAGDATFVSGTSSGDDDHGHGTHVAGIVAALDNDYGTVGVAPGVDLYAMKVLDSRGSGSWSNIAAAIEYAVDMGMDVINMSFGSSSSSQTLQAACDYANEAGVTLIAAAGNSGNSWGWGDNVLYPAKYDSVIAVAATDSSDQRPSFSSTGPTVEVTAPGSYITSTCRNATYCSKSGTSMASPHAVGVAALIIAAGVEDTNLNGRINDEVRETLGATARDLGAPGRDQQYGYGLVDAYAAAPPSTNQSPVANAGPDQEAPDADASGSETVTLDGSASYDLDGSIVSWEWSEDGTPLGSGETLPASLAVGSYTVTLTVTDNEGATGTDDATVTVSPNQTPVANAGPDQIVTDADNSGSEAVTLDGSASYDPDGSITEWKWEEDAALLGYGETFTTDFAAGPHTVTLTVTDNGLATASDQTTITLVLNQSPVADAGPDQIQTDADGSGSEAVTLDGSASYDPDGSITEWKWEEDAAILGFGETFTIDFAVGPHTVTLTVTDNGLATASDQTIITVEPNQTPVADAGPDQIVIDADDSGSEAVTLDGSASHDPDGSITEWKWEEDAAILGFGETFTTDFAVGSHTVTLTVTDNGLATASDETTITVEPNQPPVAHAGPDQTVTDADGTGNEAVTLDGSASYDPDGSITEWKWEEDAALLGYGETLTTDFAVGPHTVTLTVTDNGLATASDETTITVEPNQPPVAHAGPDQIVTDADGTGNEAVTLDGSASYDPDGSITEWKWEEDAAILGFGETFTTDFAVGSHTVTLTVTDNGLATTSDDVTLIVDEPVLPPMRVASIDMALIQRYGGWVTYAQATVNLVDIDGAPVVGAWVSGHWEDATTDSDSRSTNGAGRVTLRSNYLRRPASGTTFVFVIDSITKGGWYYHEAGGVSTGQVTVP